MSAWTLSRRMLLVTGARLAAAAWIGGFDGLGRFGDRGALRPPAGLAAFMAVSRRLTGKSELDPVFGARLYEAFVRTDPAVTTAVASLASLLDLDAGSDAADTGAAADSLGPRLARAPQPLRRAAQRLLRGWYLGLVGEGDATRCVAYETILGYRPVSDVVVMQTFCRGASGYWTARPVSGHPNAAEAAGGNHAG